MTIELLPGRAGPAGKDAYMISGSSGIRSGEVWASSLEEAIDIAEKKQPSRVTRMMQLWADPNLLTETIEHTGQVGVKVQWAKPALRQAAKKIGVPMAVAATIMASVYGASQLSRALADKQRDLISESAALAWKDFAKTHKVRVGDKRVRIDKLPETIAVQVLQAFVIKKIVQFQRNTYE